MKSFRLALLLFVLSFLRVAATTLSAPEVSLGSAFTFLQANDTDAAIKILKEITTKQPSNLRAWRMLGTAYHQKKDWQATFGSGLLNESLTSNSDAPGEF